jgi:hypothetical protein
MNDLRPDGPPMPPSDAERRPRRRHGPHSTLASLGPISRGLAACLAAALAACSQSTPVVLPASTLSHLSGPVSGYLGSETLPVVGISMTDGTLLAAGVLHPMPGARVEGTLLHLDHVPPEALAPFEGCATMTVAPAILRGAGFPFLFAGDGEEALALLTLADISSDHDSLVPGDRVFVHVLVDRAGRIEGTCDEDWMGSVTYDVSLRQGWNVIVYRVTTVDWLGNMTAVATAGTAAPGASWHFSDSFVPMNQGVRAPSFVPLR